LLLIEAFDAVAEESVEEAWRFAIERRIAELDSAAVDTVPWEELRARLRRR
jgi:putative addiction module component (TIGR02574 family)